jgi:hypothetical protein
MDDDGVWQRQKGEIPVKAWREAASPEIQNKYFGARGFQKGLSRRGKRVCSRRDMGRIERT